MATRLWFLRHGELEAGKVGAFVGRSEAALSPLGRHQAEAIKAYLQDAAIDAVLSSPSRRARDTVAPLAAHHGRIVDARAGLAEMDFGQWEGLRWPDIEARDAAYAARWRTGFDDLPCPGGESGRQFLERVTSTLAGVLDEFRGRSVVVAGHAGTNRCILASVLGLGYAQAFAFVQDYGCLNAAAWSPDGSAQLALVNFVPGPRSTHPGND